MTENNYNPGNGQPEQPQYQPPVYAEPQYPAPQYQPPQYAEPQYQAPQYAEPQYQQPQYEAPQYQAPQYEQPQYQYAQPQYQQPQYQYAQPQYQQAQPVGEAPSASKMMIFSIIGLALVAFFYTSIPGFIFSIIAKNMVGGYESAGYPVEGQAKVAKILSKIGFIVGLIFSILFTLWLIIMAVG